MPHSDLQTFFLVFRPRALTSPVLWAVLDGMHALLTKKLVVDAYETALTRQVAALGLSVAALFAPLYDDPFVKASLLRAGPQAEQVRACLPAGLLPPVEAA